MRQLGHDLGGQHKQERARVNEALRPRIVGQPVIHEVVLEHADTQGQLGASVRQVDVEEDAVRLEQTVRHPS
eukprot:7926354-Alexandrium_andersonii.AAC.1